MPLPNNGSQQDENTAQQENVNQQDENTAQQAPGNIAPEALQNLNSFATDILTTPFVRVRTMGDLYRLIRAVEDSLSGIEPQQLIRDAFLDPAMRILDRIWVDHGEKQEDFELKPGDNEVITNFLQTVYDSMKQASSGKPADYFDALAKAGRAFVP